MTLKFKKGGKSPAVLSCIRKDGSITWAKQQPAIEIHDLAHYVIETELSFTNAFYGMLAQGFDIGDFELPRERRPKALLPRNLSIEALQTEHMVNLLMVNLNNKGNDKNFMAMLRSILEENNMAFPTGLNSESLARINRNLKKLISQWAGLKEGEVMELQFDLSKMEKSKIQGRV